MESSEKTQLGLIAEVVGIAQELGLQVWLRGGWGVDFYLGVVTRAHADIDFFVLDGDCDELARALDEAGFITVAGPPPEQQLDFTKAGQEVSIARVRRGPGRRVLVAGGPHAGEDWPEGMLDGPVGTLAGTSCRVISPGSQVEIKEMMPIWVPGRPRREKDRQDIKKLREAL